MINSTHLLKLLFNLRVLKQCHLKIKVLSNGWSLTNGTIGQDCVEEVNVMNSREKIINRKSFPIVATVQPKQAIFVT